MVRDAMMATGSLGDMSREGVLHRNKALGLKTECEELDIWECGREKSVAE